MTGALEATDADDPCIQSAKLALLRVCAHLPYLSGLAYAVRIAADDRVGTAGIFASGRLLVNRSWFEALAPDEATFIMAHELLHLALQTHSRGVGADGWAFNCAHDYIINDMLRDALGMEVPAGGLDMPGASERSAEELLLWLQRRGELPPQGQSAWRASAAAPGGILADALDKALGGDASEGDSQPAPDDVLDAELERKWFPDDVLTEQRVHQQQIASKAVRSLELQALEKRLDDFHHSVQQPGGHRGYQDGFLVEARRLAYQPPWQAYLQQWFENGVPGVRSYARASRRQGSRTDIVLVGRKREAHTLHLVLDTSGSMSDEFAVLLGLIAGFAESVNVETVRIVQCDTEVASDQWVTPAELSNFEIRGWGGSDMSPGMDHLAADPFVERAIVLTDGYIGYPEQPPPYSVLWGLTSECSYFSPPYGQVITLGGTASECQAST